MRWSIIRLIWLRELRDQLRDRRTVFMIAVLPILLYPLAGLGILQMTLGFFGKQTVVGIQGHQYLPQLTPHCTAFSPLPVLSWLTATPAAPGVPLGGLERVSGALTLDWARRSDPRQDYPPLILGDGDTLRFAPVYLESAEDADRLLLRLLDAPTHSLDGRPDDLLTRVDRTALDSRQVDLLLVVPANFQELLRKDGRPLLYVLTRDGDEHSRIVDNRLTPILRRWKQHLKEVRLRRRSLPADYDQVIEVRDTVRAKPASKRASDDLLDMLVRIFPFVLVMWSLAGALYPAVDLCAGEKERGTMETLLISPAGRAEIVYGKFLTIWIFSAATALLNLLSMGATTWHFSHMLAADAAFRPAALFWAVALLLPLSAFFSAICLAIGAYARSTKEGQYYLMPLFLVTMPLIVLTLAPGVELNHFYSMVPVTGVALLLQKLIAVKPPDGELWGYFVPVLAPMVVYSWLALRWAIEQFQREEVLFREAERLDMGLWLRRLFREKESLPSAGQAFFCFALIFGLHWLSLGGGRVSVAASHAIRYLAFVAAPALFMVLMLTTRPAQGLALRWPTWWTWPISAALAVLLLPPFSALTIYLLDQFPLIKQAAAHGFATSLPKLQTMGWVVFVILPAVCEELAFRGFLLSGLRRRFRPWPAILLSSFLYALYQMNVLQALPHFLLGVVLALLVLRTGSVGGAIVFRLVWESLLWAPLLMPDWFPVVEWSNAGVVLICVILASPLLAFLRPSSVESRSPLIGADTTFGSEPVA
ncbi:MAG TPA: ABC transporter permease subunit/CPBP intramembrane protease [Gemmataceae bacterium]|nr:ABC transporter permease subunit/CPBP intramembrane protease [Gemmataceae bacterium]